MPRLLGAVFISHLKQRYGNVMQNLLFEIAHPSDSVYVDHIFFGDVNIPLKHPEQKFMCANMTIRKLPFKGYYTITVGDTRRLLLNIKSPTFTLDELKRQTRDLKELTSILIPGSGLRLREIKLINELPLYLNAIYRTKLPIGTHSNVIQTTLLTVMRNKQRVKSSAHPLLHKPLYLDKPEPLKYLEYKNGLLFNHVYNFNVSNLGFHIEETPDSVTFTSGTTDNPITIIKDLEMGEIDGGTIWELVYERIKADINHRLHFVLNKDTNEAWETLSGHVIGVPNKLTWEDVFSSYLENNKK